VSDQRSASDREHVSKGEDRIKWESICGVRVLAKYLKNGDTDSGPRYSG